jgi:hypothetical protein
MMGSEGTSGSHVALCFDGMNKSELVLRLLGVVVYALPEEVPFPGFALGCAVDRVGGQEKVELSRDSVKHCATEGGGVSGIPGP